MDSEQINCVARAIRNQNRHHICRQHPETKFSRDALTADERRLARAAIAALPDCIPDLVWTFADPPSVLTGDVYKATSHLGWTYLAWHDGSWRIHKGGTTGWAEPKTLESAQAACNEHHRDAIMSAFKKD